MNEITAHSKPLSAITVAAGAAGTDAITGSTIDTLDFRGVLFLVSVGPIVSGAATSLKLQHGDASDLSDAADILGTSQTIADTDDNTLRYVDLFKPVKRYVRLVVSRATQAATVAAIALPYGVVSGPVAQSVTGELHASPASGTA